MKRRGMTLIEILTCIAIIGIVAAISFPALASAKRAGYARQSASDLKQIAVAAMLYREQWKKTDYGDMESMGLPAIYPTLFGVDAFQTTSYPMPPILWSKYPAYYYMPLPKDLDGRAITWEKAVLAHQERTLLICDPWLEGFIQGRPRAYSYSLPNRIYGVDLGGQLMRKKAYGEFYDFDRWEYK